MNIKVTVGILLICVFSIGSVYAQNKGSQGNKNKNQGSDNPKPKTIEYRVESGSGRGFDTVKPGLGGRGEVIERNLDKGRVPLPFENIREDDAVYRQRVWRIIDTREKMNAAFRNNWEEDNGEQAFILILMDAIKKGKVLAFKDDRFTEIMPMSDIMSKIGGGMDTSEVVDVNTGEIAYYSVKPNEINWDSVYQYKVKEEWIFDKESSKLYVRIIGICPIISMASKTSGAKIGDFPLFWVYYPDYPKSVQGSLRPLLAEYETFNPKNFGARMTWEELFENRMFSSYVTKSTMENPYNREIREYVKDPILRLLEGDRIMEKIFNHEQNQWSY